MAAATASSSSSSSTTFPPPLTAPCAPPSTSRPASRPAAGASPAKRRRVRAAATVRRLWQRTRWTSLLEAERSEDAATTAGKFQDPEPAVPPSTPLLDPKEEIGMLREIVAELQRELSVKPDLEDKSVSAKPDVVDKAVAITAGMPLTSQSSGSGPFGQISGGDASFNPGGGFFGQNTGNKLFGTLSGGGLFGASPFTGDSLFSGDTGCRLFGVSSTEVETQQREQPARAASAARPLCGASSEPFFFGSAALGIPAMPERAAVVAAPDMGHPFSSAAKDWILAEARVLIRNARKDVQCVDLRADLLEMAEAALRPAPTTEEAQDAVSHVLFSLADEGSMWFADQMYYLIDDVAHGKWGRALPV